MLKQQIQASIISLAIALTPITSAFADEHPTVTSTEIVTRPAQIPSTSRTESTDGQAYNEMVGPNGLFRPHYQRFHEQHSLQPISPELAARLNDRPLKDSIRILPIPLILTEDDNRTLDEGSRQVGQALRMFFADIFINPHPTIYNSGIINEAQVRAILLASTKFGSVTPMKYEVLRHIWSGMNENDVRFIAGPDIIRGQSKGNGKPEYTALEVNVNNIGGSGDVDMAHAVYKAALLTPGVAAIVPEKIFVRVAAENFVAPFQLDLSHPSVIVEQIDTSSDDDDEDEDPTVMVKDREDHRIHANLSSKTLKKARFADIFAMDLHAEARRLQVANNDETIGTAAHPLQVVNFNDPLLFFESYGNLEIAMKMFKARELRFFTSPGTEFLANKALMPFIDDIVHYYLNETPALSMQPTTWVKSTDLIGQRKQNTVIKPSNGSQGSGVTMEKMLSADERTRLINILKRKEVSGRMLGDGESHVPTYVRQDFVNQSYLPSSIDENSGTIYSNVYNVDIRELMYVDGSHTYLHPRKWGRASPKLPGTLTNVSISGSELIVLSPKQAEELISCPALLRHN